jgi:hypothetical protein
MIETYYIVHEAELTVVVTSSSHHSFTLEIQCLDCLKQYHSFNSFNLLQCVLHVLTCEETKDWHRMTSFRPLQVLQQDQNIRSITQPLTKLVPEILK